MSELPWDAALLDANRAQAARVVELEAENAELRETVTMLRVKTVGLQRRLRQAKEIHANWLLRQQAWRAERADLVRRLPAAATAPSIEAYRRWGPGS